MNKSHDDLNTGEKKKVRKGKITLENKRMEWEGINKDKTNGWIVVTFFLSFFSNPTQITVIIFYPLITLAHSSNGKGGIEQDDDQNQREIYKAENREKRFVSGK